jgi:hypothetical protein
VSKVVALQEAETYVKNLTAREVIDYCNQRLRELQSVGDTELALGFQLGRAYAETIAGDLQQALTDYSDAQNRLTALNTKWAENISAQVGTTLRLLKIKAKRAPSINYNVHPFESIYHWAPFILVGDWK